MTHRSVSRTRLLLIAVTISAQALFVPVVGLSQCGTPAFLKVHHLWRVGFNSVEALAGTQVDGVYWYNWDTYVQSTEKLNGSLLHSGSDTGIGGISAVQWNDAPSGTGVGTFTTSNFHSAECSSNYTESTSADSLSVAQPTIGNLPYNNSLWYFGAGTPGAVPVSGGYAFQYADLVFNKNCNAGDSCSGSVTWSELDPSSLISVSSSGRLESTNGGTCQYDSAVRATLNGWQISEPILVNSPEFLWHPSAEETLSFGTGYQTREYWSVKDSCSPANSIPSVALNEQFGTFANPGVISGWPNPAATSAAGYNYDTYTFYDTIAASTDGTYNPVPTFTSSSPPYTYNTRIKYAPQSWNVGTQTFGSGRQVFSGTIEYYRDHGDSYE